MLVKGTPDEKVHKHKQDVFLPKASSYSANDKIDIAKYVWNDIQYIKVFAACEEKQKLGFKKLRVCISFRIILCGSVYLHSIH